ncbi:MAG TPA: hypothetical protein VK203_07085, partial [Nostocaceae cyanobacterium]|nr:hypothetical protein [Nostocaceae cyanobacterium]
GRGLLAEILTLTLRGGAEGQRGRGENLLCLSLSFFLRVPVSPRLRVSSSITISVQLAELNSVTKP